MGMSIKLTNELKTELEGIRDRINAKMKTFSLMQPLPYDRMAKGRDLKDLVNMCIESIDKGEDFKLMDMLEELEKKGIKLKNTNTKKGS